MFLALPPVIAAGRAIFAFAVVVLSMSGHASAGHQHVDLSRVALAFLLLLAAAWRTNDARLLLAASVAAQCLVHGGLPIGNLSMFSMHASGAALAFFLIWQFELLWAVCLEMLRPLCQPIQVPPPSTASATTHHTAWRNPFRSHVRFLIAPVRGPPVFA